jgi:peptide/nickel transport system permease protein
MPVIFTSDLIVYLLFAGALYFIWAVRKEGILREAWKDVRKRRLAMACLVVLSAYFMVALADSIRWRDAVRDDLGRIVRSPGGNRIYSANALSVLDRALSKIRLEGEKTYSAPLAARLYTKESMELPDGRVVRDYSRLKYPGTHLFGTDKVGNDVLYTALKGIRTGIVIGAGATIVIIPFAILFGVVAGYYGGVVDDVVQYLYTTLASIPGVLLIVAFMLLFGLKGYQGGLVQEKDIFLGTLVPNDRLFWLCLILGVTSWTDLCRLIRGETLKLRELEYVQAGRAFGVSRPGIIYRHIVPNLMHLVLITFVLQFSGLVLTEAILSYISIGVGPQMFSWGNMINTARLELSMEPVVWWNLLASFVFMFGLVLPANIFGDAVRDALDPRLRLR